MWSHRFRSIGKATRELVALLILLTACTMAQSPGALSPQPQGQLQERERLRKQADELRQAGNLDEAVAAAERALEWERQAGEKNRSPEAEALSRLAELHELRGDWGQAVARRKEALAIRVQVDGEEHWRTADARLALAFAEKVAALGQADRAKVQETFGKEQEAARLEEQGKLAEAERVALEALETYRALVGPESVEVARAWQRIGRFRVARHDAGGAKEANEKALAIRRRSLPPDHPNIAASLNNLGLAQCELREYAAAKQNLEEALAILRKSQQQDDPDIALSLSNLGNTQFRLWEFAAAKESHEQALAIRRKSLPPDHPDIAASLNNLGLAQCELREYAAAKQNLEEALAILRKSQQQDDPDIAGGLNNLGNVQYALREYAAAKQTHEQALAIRRKTLPPDDPDIVASLINLGKVQFELRDYETARQCYQEALAIFRKSLPQEDPKIARCLNNLGVVQYALREYAAARQSHEQALAICRKSLPPDHPDIAASLNNLGNVQNALQEYSVAKQSHEEALAIRRKSLRPDHPDIAMSLKNLGNVQFALREYAAAKQCYDEVLVIRRKSLPPDHPDIAASLNNLGLAQCELREYAAAKQNLEQALAIIRKSLPQEDPEIARCLNNLGVVQYELREYAAARQSHEQALAIRRKSLPASDSDIATSLTNLGSVQSELGEHAAAKQSFEQALAILRVSLPPDQPTIAKNLNNLGNLQAKLRDYAAAKQSFRDALAICSKSLPPDHPDIAFSLNNLGRLSLRSGVGGRDAVLGLAEATDLFQAEQLRLSSAQAEPEQLATAAQARISLGNLISATLLARAGPAATHDRVMRAKGSVTAQQRWVRQARDTADPETRTLLDRLHQLNRELVSLSFEGTSADRKLPRDDLVSLIWNLHEERSELERQLTERSAVYRSFQERARVGSGEIRAALPAGSALIDLVDYFHVEPPEKGQTEPVAEPRIVAFVVRPEPQEVVIVPLGASNELSKWIDRWRASYGAGKAPPAGEADPGVELRKRLWEPLAKHLEGIQLVLVSPDGPINGLPWAALPGSKEGTFLVHEYAFAVVPVPQLLPELLRGKPGLANEQPSLLLAGGIDFGKQIARDPEAPAGNRPPVSTYKRLEGTGSEVSDLERRFRRTFPQADPPLVLDEDQATKQAILAAAPSHRFVHLATHGFFADESQESAATVAQRDEDFLRGGLHLNPEAVGLNPGLLSGIVFAGVNLPDRRPEESILTALEASELELSKVDLVVLSACETGRGLVAGGEGVLGLQRAFQLAGARSVVASLWKVPDEETHQLMREFYKCIWSETPISRAEALRKAQLWMLDNWKDRGGLERPQGPQGPPPPYVWAAFVLSGDWR